MRTGPGFVWIRQALMTTAPDRQRRFFSTRLESFKSSRHTRRFRAVLASRTRVSSRRRIGERPGHNGLTPTSVAPPSHSAPLPNGRRSQPRQRPGFGPRTWATAPRSPRTARPTPRIEDSHPSLRAILSAWGFRPAARVSVTGTCNYDCSFCHNEGNHKKDKGLAPERYRDIAGACIRLGIRAVKFTGGEPLLRRDLEEIVRAFGGLGLEDLSIVTNGLLLTPCRQQSLREAGIRRATVSLHSTDPIEYSRLFNCHPDRLDSVLENIRSLAETLPGSKINALIMPGLNFPHGLIPLVKLASSLRLPLSLLATLDGSPSIIPDCRRLIERHLGVTEEEVVTKRLGSCSILHLVGGASVEIDDFRQQGAERAKSNPYCLRCPVRAICVEGPYALRIKADGTAKPCLARSDNEVIL